jgi:ABC-2 type transport system permease protein
MSIATAPPRTTSFTAAFWALVVFSFARQWRVRQMAWVALGLLVILAVTVAVMSFGPSGWGLENRYSMRFDALVKKIPEQLDIVQMTPNTSEGSALSMMVFASFRGILADQKFLDDWAFLNFSRWVVFAMHLSFLMPLFTLAYASAGMGSERESRTLIWLLTRPMPRWAIYLAKFLGGLPWALAASGGGFVVLCLAGGSLGLRALVTFWPAVLMGTIGFAALFHLMGTVFRRPAVVGLVYIFFFELLVANLPGSLKQLSLNYYIRSLLYNEATGALTVVAPESLDVYAPASPLMAWATVMGVTVVLTLIGMVIFTRQEPQDET